MKWRIQGVLFETGNAVEIDVEADDEAHAKEIAAFQRIAVERMIPLHDVKGEAAVRHDRRIAVAVLIALGVLVGVAFIGGVISEEGASARPQAAPARPSYQGPTWVRAAPGDSLARGVRFIGGEADEARRTPDGVYVMWTIAIENFSGKGQHFYTVRPVYLNDGGAVVRIGDPETGATAATGESPHTGDDLIPAVSYDKIRDIVFEFRKGG
tara:strand:+ start:1865 stop:2497 length:633 start_codon:yes stop_codon:yes gene_type:complete